MYNLLYWILVGLAAICFTCYLAAVISFIGWIKIADPTNFFGFTVFISTVTGFGLMAMAIATE